MRYGPKVRPAKFFSLSDSNCAATSTAGDSMNVRFWSLNTSNDSSSSLNAVSAAQALARKSALAAGSSSSAAW